MARKQTAESVVQSWRWRIIKAGLTMERFAINTGRRQSQMSDWVRGHKKPKPESIDAVEKDLKNLGV